MPTSQLDQLAGLLSVSLKEMAPILQVAERTLHRFRSGGYLDERTSERFLLLENVIAHGLMVFDGQADALANWLRYPLRELKNQAPLTLLTTISGFGLVDDVLPVLNTGFIHKQIRFMLVYRLYKSAYITEPLSAEGARRAGGRWNPKGYPILFTSATPELALLEVIAHLNPAFIPRFQLLVLDIPDIHRVVLPADLPIDWQDEQKPDSVQTYLDDWLKKPQILSVSVPSSIVSRSNNYLLHTLHADFLTAVKFVENEPFQLDSRIVKSQQ